jgi:hypothetical protein
MFICSLVFFPLKVIHNNKTLNARYHDGLMCKKYNGATAVLSIHTILYPAMDYKVMAREKERELIGLEYRPIHELL